MLSMVVRLSLVVLGVHIASDIVIARYFGDLSQTAEIVLELGMLIPATCIGLWYQVVRGLHAQLDRQEFTARLQRAFEMAPTETACLEVVERVLSARFPDHGVQLLVADSSDAHLKHVVDAGVPEVAGCTVQSPHDCPAIRQARTLTFADSEALDACPHLRRGDEHRSAVCSPVSIMGKAVAVLHVAGPTRRRAPKETGETLEGLANQTGARLGMLRVLERTHLQAATDPLTGLVNRRTLEHRAHSLAAANTPFALVVGDLDHFKRLNDVHGHELGDRALRVFARTVQSCVRDIDVVCRYGGEEFVVLLPELDGRAAGAVLDRIQDKLAVTVTQAGLPAFTVSFGVALSSCADDFAELFRTADAALFQAKRDGRNRIVVDQASLADSTTTGAVVRPVTDHPPAAFVSHG